MATYNNTITFSTPIAKQILAASTILSPVVVAVTNLINIRWGVRWGPLSTTNLTNPAIVIVEYSQQTSGDDGWQEIDRFVSQPGASLATQTVNGAGAAAGQPVLPIGTTSGFSVDDYVFVQNTVSVLNSEWKRVASIQAATSLTFTDNLSYAQNTTSVVWRGGQRYSNTIDVSNIARLRFTADNGLNAVTGGSVFEVVLNSANSFG